MQIIISKQAQKNIEKLDKTTKLRIKSAISGLPAGDIKKLQGHNSYRLRIGNFRVIYDITEDTIRIINVLSRGEAYKKF